MAKLLKQWRQDVLVLALASPILAMKGLWTAARKGRFLAVASMISMACECGSEISLVGMWRCTCGFTYKGHLLQICPVCGALPCVIRCYVCGVTTKLPEP